MALGAVIPERLFHYRVRDDSMMREIGAPSVERIAGEVRARRREHAMRWTVETATGAGASLG